MARKLVLILCASLSFASVSAFATAQNSAALSLSGLPGQGVALDVSRTNPEFTSISMINPDIQALEMVEDFETYHVMSLQGEPVLPVEGAPAVPQVTRFYRIPNTGGVDLLIRSAEFEIQEGINPYPYHSEAQGFNRDARDPAIYSKDGWYPSEVAVISDPIIFRDFRLVAVSLYPVQVNPMTGQARVYGNISVDLVANNEPGIDELLNPRQPSGLYSRLYRDFIENLDEHALDDATTTPGTYLIIAKDHATVNQHVLDLAEWKTRKGHSVVIEQRTSWSSNQIQSFVRNFALDADPPLEFVCLIGDPQPAFGVPTMGNQYDHAYAIASDGDNVEDWGVGRLSGSTASEMATIMAKLLNYESNPYMAETDWFTSGYFTGDVGHQIASNYTLMQWTARQFANNTGIVNNDVAYTSNGANYNAIQNQFEDGISIFFWRGSWLGQMDASLAPTCNSGWKLPVVLTVTCGSGNFDYTVGTQESYLIAGTPANPKGGIAAIGTATSGTHAPQNITFAGGLSYAMANQEIEHLGTALNAAKFWLTKTWGPGSAAETNFSSWNNLMGDPGLSYWTDIPVILDVGHPSTLNVGTREVAVTVLKDDSGLPVEDALVVLWKGEVNETPESYAKGLTDANGEIVLPVTIDTPGDLRLTITKRNHKPYLFDIPCVVVDQMVSVETVVLDDDMAGGTDGNNNQEYNPGETIDLAVTLKNHGSTNTATGVAATLTCDNENITVVNGSSTYNDLAPGEEAAGDSPFRIQISPTMKHGESALLRFDVTSNAAPSNSSVELLCKAGQMEVVTHQFIGGNLDPGTQRDLRITILNSGDLAMNDVNITLASMSPFISINNPTVNFGDIAVGQQITNNSDLYEIAAIALTYPGHQATLQAYLETSDGYRDTTQFTVTAGTASSTDPTGPDAYGYFAYDNTDAGYEWAPTYDYMNISASLGIDLNINDSGEKTSPTSVWSTVRELPFDFTYYGISYDTVTICANGWLAFGDQGWDDNFRNFPLPSMVGADAMLCPYWDDLKTSGGSQGVWEYYDSANHRYVIQWKAGVGGFSYTTPVDFEVILYDPEFYPTFDGNGNILFQYADLPSSQATYQQGNGGEAPGCSIGMHNETALVGLSLAYQNQYAPGVASWVDGRAILISTESRALFGIIEGTVLDAENDEPMADVDVTLDGFNYLEQTDAAGFYRIENVLVGNYTVRAHKFGFNDATVSGIVVELDSTEEANFSLPHPEFVLSTEEITVEIPADEPTTSFEIINDGNGPLDYTIEIVYTGGGDPVDPWGQIEDIDLSGPTGDMQILGCEFVGDHWYVSGGNGQPGNNRLYKFDLNGEYVGSIPQPSTSAFGWYDLAYDGEYLYGSEDGTGVIHGIDMEGNIQETIPSPLNPTRAIAYDPDNDRFWVADYTQDLFEIDRDGSIYNQITNQGTDELAITGLAWNPSDPDGYKLYIFSQNGTGNQTLVSKMHTFSYDVQNLTVLDGEDGDHAGGCAITGGWNSTLLVFGGILQNSTTGDRLGIYQIDFNTVWIDVAPLISTVEGATSREISVVFDTGILRNATYQVSLLIYNDVLDTELDLPVILTVDLIDAADPHEETTIPVEYALYQNFPNPFNPSTTIRYDLKNAGPTSLKIYNIVGRQVVELVNEVQQAGSHTLHFDAASLTSGVYFYRLTSGDFTQTSKMVLMK